MILRLQSIVHNYSMLQTIQRLRKVSRLVKCLTIVFKERHNVQSMRLWPSTKHPIHKVRVLLILALTHILHRRLLIYSCYMTLIRQLNRGPEMVASIEPNKANDVLNLKGVGEAAWNFISALYDSGWDSLVSDKDNCSF